MVGEVADVTAAVCAALTAEGWRVRRVVPGAEATCLGGERWQANLAEPASLRRLHELLREADARPVAAVLNLLGLCPAFRAAGTEDEEATANVALWTFNLARQFADELSEGGAFVNVTALDGQFGLGEGEMPSAAAAGTLGVVKTLGREYPRARARNIDVEPTLPADVLALRLLGELTAEDERAEVGLTRHGRWRPALVEAPAPRDVAPLPLGTNSVVLVTGGARGITAEVVRRLAAEARPRLVLVGRSPLPEAESPRTHGLDRPAVRRLLLDEARAAGAAVVPAEIEAEVNRLLRRREVRATLDACTAAGAAVEYHALDVRDATAFGRLIDDVYERLGRIDGAIHGAGIIDDRRIRDKTPESFAAVFRTKVAGALTLARKLRPEGLKFLAFFGSVVGRFGNAGQVDYAAANEVLNKLADRLRRRWPGRVVCLNWGPWQGGMVSDELRRLYEAAGVELLPLADGAAACLAELRRAERGSAEVVLARGVERLASGGRKSTVAYAAET